ncbi:MAG: right-handed parallel beta-helix repeat-containing protein [Patescibacteria group bacterium]
MFRLKPGVVCVQNGCLGFTLLATFVGLFFIQPQVAWATTYTVNSTDDNNDGACTHPYVDAANDCTMREAINASNTSAGADTILISINASFTGTSDGHGQQTTTVTTAYNALTGPVTVDATGMWDVDENRPGFRLYSTSTSIAGLTFGTGAAGSKVKGLEIQGYNAAINIGSGVTGAVIGTDCDGTNDAIERNVLHGASNHEIRTLTSDGTIAGNYIGVNDDGLTVTGTTTLYGIWLSGASADNNTIGFAEGKACSAAAQRNVIGGTFTVSGSGIRIEGSGTANTSGDSTLGPNGNRISGNYIGIGADGTTKIAITGAGVQLLTNATLNFIGTDGDAVEDGSEGNVLSGSGNGVLITVTGNNRISGNTIGLNAAGTAAVANSLHGANLRGTANIVGWCDTAVHASLCNNSGTLAQQRNVISGNTEDGLRLGFAAYNTGVYGNYIGTGTDGTTTIANGDNGVFIHRTDTGNSIGGASLNQTNLIQGHDAGVRIDGEFIGASGRGGGQGPVESNTIQNNTIQQNLIGIYNYWTENYSADGPTDNTITGNTISNNTSYGIDVYGSSPSITNNTISNNGSYGIYIHPAFVTYDADTEATTTDGNNPENASDNLISRPVVTGNTLSGNTSGGIFQADSRANNYTTLYADNTIGNNADQFDIKQDWVGTTEVLDKDGAPLPSSALASTSVTLTPAAGGIAVTYSASDTTTASGLTQNIFGATGVDYPQASTWPLITEYVVDSNGNQTNYGPYSITTSGTYTTATAYTYTFDGTENDTAYTNALPNGVATDSQYRYQIAKVLASTVPATPSNSAPYTGSTTSNLTPTLSASAFSEDSGDTHASSTWRMYSTSALCSADSTGDVLNTTSASSLTAYVLSSGTLQEATTYYWRVAYTNSFGNRSAFSSCTSFTTIQTTPSFSGSITGQLLQEDTALANAFDLDTYFSDAEGESLTFSVLSTDTPDQISLSIDVNGQVSFSPASNYTGSDTVTFRACDTDSQCANSNSVTLTVSGVNDAPQAPGAGFSPCCGNTTSDQTPTISWTAAIDDDSTSQLSYEIRLGTVSDPTTTYSLSQTTELSAVSVQITDTLADETTYYYVVRTKDAAGLTSDWSEVQEFYVNTANLPELSLSKQVSASGSSWLYQLYDWARQLSAVLPWSMPVLASHEAYATYDVENTSSTHYVQQGDVVVSQVSPVGAVGILIETLIGVFLLAFGVAFIILLRQSHKPKQFIALLFGNPASSFFNLFMGDNVTIEAISYAHFKAKLQFTRLLLASTFIGVAALFIVHQVFTPQSSIAAKLASEAATGSVEPGDTVTIILTYRNSGDGDATNVIITDTIPSGINYVPGSGSLNGTVQVDTTFISGSTITLELGTISNRDSSDSSGTVSYQVRLENPFDDSSVRFPVASLDANEVSSPAVSNSVLFDVTGARITGSVVNGTTGNGISSVELIISQEGTSLDSDITTSAGAYSFSGLADGTYRISVESVEGYEAVDARRVTVEAGDTLSIDFELTKIATGGEDLNENVNGDTNTNSNKNGNANENANTNTNTNGNVNENVNANENTNDEVNGNENTNANENTNTNENTNQAPNDNTNGGIQEPDNEEEIPEDVIEDLPEPPDLTPEEENLKDELTETLDLFSINETPVTGGVVGVVGANSLAGLPSEYVKDLDTVLLPTGTTEVVLRGHAMPDSKVTITICSQAYVQVTQTDDAGTWNMVVPRELFEEGEHIAVAAAEKDGVTSDQIEIARFVVLDELLVTSRTALVLGLNILLLTLFANLVLWGAKRSRSRQTDPLLPETTLSPAEQLQNVRRFTRAFMLYVLAIVAFVAVFFIPHPRLFDMRATVPSDAEKIVVTHVNQDKMSPGIMQHFRYVSMLHLEGIAPKDTAIAITLCPGVTFRSTATGPNGEWALDIPLIVMPKGQFSMQGQFDVAGQLGIPHTIAEFKLANVQILPRDYILYGISLLCVIFSMITLWSKAKKTETAFPHFSDVEPSDMPELD